MKKFKKISALLAASVITAGTVSAMSAGALAHFNSKEEMDEILKETYMLPYNPDATGWYKYQRQFLAETEYDNFFDYYDITGVAPDRISAALDLDVDTDALITAMKEICPDAEVVSVTNDADSNVVCVKGMDNSENYYLPYSDVRKKDVTYEQTLKIYDLLNETGKLKSFEYTKVPVSYSYVGTSWLRYESYYDKENDELSDIEKMQNYITENNLDLTIKITYSDIMRTSEKSYQFDEYFVKPGKRMSAEEIVKLDKQIEDDLGIISGILVPDMAYGSSDPITIDMHNNIKGDANGDGELRLSDAIMILQAIGNPDEYELTAQGKYNADIYGDRDGITTMDAVAVQRKILGLE